MNITRKFLSWFDNHLLFFLSGFLLAFIPLFPKLPLFDVIPGYIVRVRLEDFLIAIAIIIWLVQLWRKKISFGPNPLAKPILIYLTVGLLSMLSAIFITRTVPLEILHIGKMALHFLRRIEYFSLFFIFYSTVKSIKQVKTYLLILIVTILGVTLYGYGQKYLYWPAFSTMNREFSKGWALYLTQHARVISTFGGHYDLAAYAMMALILLWSLFFNIEKKLYKLIIFIILAGTFWLLILTASRTSFIAYMVGVTVLFGFWTFRKGIMWSAKRWFIVTVLSMFVMLSFGDLSDRFTKLLKLDQRLGGIKSLLTQPFSAPPIGDNIVLLENNIEAVTSKSDFPLLPIRPSDVTDIIPEGTIATQTASGAAITKVVQRNYSKTALVYDLSTGIRLDALWPRAIAGFKKNPLLGTGYSTLTKIQVNEFTEAESTDNDYLRALGETGLLGLLAFGWILVAALSMVWKAYTSITDKVIFGMITALTAIIIGLLVNAVYIDIFEASKVALYFWAITGIILGSIKITSANKFQPPKLSSISDLSSTLHKIKQITQKIYRSDKTYLLIIIILALVVRHYKISEPLADWHSWRQADTSAVTRNFVRYGLNLFYPRYDDLSSIASGIPNPQGYRFVEFPLYSFFAVLTDKLFPGYNVEYSGRLTSIFASIGTLIFLYFLVKKYLGVRVGMLTAGFFALLPYNIFWSRTILPEPTLVFLTTAMLYTFDKWVETSKWKYWVISVIFAVLSLLVKFTAAFFVIPMLYLAWNKWKFKTFTNIWLYIYAILTVLPFIAWRIHISKYPEGVPAYQWLFNGNGIRFKGAWFWWLFSERIGHLILGTWGVGLFLLGMIRQVKNKITGTNIWFFHYWLTGLIIYLIVFATGNVQHDYYQIILVPILCIFLAIGTDFLLIKSDLFHQFFSKLVLIIWIVFMLMFGWYQARDFFNINHPEIVEAGREFDRVISNNKVLVIAPYGGDTAFLYQTGRRGWPLMEGTIDEMIAKGAHYYISTNFDDTTNKIMQMALNNQLGKDQIHQFKIIKQTPSYVIIQLVPDKFLPKTN